MATYSRSHHHEVWSRTETGSVEKHGAAFGVTFEDACKHLAPEPRAITPRLAPPAPA